MRCDIEHHDKMMHVSAPIISNKTLETLANHSSDANPIDSCLAAFQNSSTLVYLKHTMTLIPCAVCKLSWWSDWQITELFYSTYLWFFGFSGKFTQVDI